MNGVNNKFKKIDTIINVGINGVCLIIFHPSLNSVLKFFQYFPNPLISGSFSRASVGIVIKDGSNKIVYNQVKNLRTINSNISLNILLKWIKKGKYYFTLSVSDLLINKQISEYLKADVK